MIATIICLILGLLVGWIMAEAIKMSKTSCLGSIAAVFILFFCLLFALSLVVIAAGLIGMEGYFWETLSKL